MKGVCYPLLKIRKKIKCTKCKNTSILKNEARLLKVTNVKGKNIVMQCPESDSVICLNLPHIKYNNVITTSVKYILYARRVLMYLIHMRCLIFTATLWHRYCY